MISSWNFFHWLSILRMQLWLSRDAPKPNRGKIEFVKVSNRKIEFAIRAKNRILNQSPKYQIIPLISIVAIQNTPPSTLSDAYFWAELECN